MPVRVGIPRGLLYYYYYPLWEKFFTLLDTEVIVSERTNRLIVEDGVKNCVEDACLPVKIYHGHVLQLKKKVDYILVPKMMSIQKNEFICPKFCGLPEMIKYSLDNLPVMIDTTIDFRKSRKNLLETIYEMGGYFTGNKKKIKFAFEKALINFNQYKKSIKKGFLPIDGFSNQPSELGKHTNNENKIVLLGHPYVLYDSHISMDLIKKLRFHGFTVLTQDNFDNKVINQKALIMDKKMFWTFGRKILGAAFYAMEQEDIKGLIYLSSFSCGLDSVIAEIVERRIRRNSRKPFALLTIDEHTGETGFNTRVEAFIDMIGWREKNENHLSTHG
jgi:predicted nucleotide-binding protein (sugar kinase/HSP70/actin superfamily)